MKPGSVPYSDESVCLAEGFNKRLFANANRVAGKIRMIGRGTLERNFIVIDSEVIKQKARRIEFPPVLWVDSLTGQLFDPKTRSCLSSDQLVLAP